MLGGAPAPAATPAPAPAATPAAAAAAPATTKVPVIPDLSGLEHCPDFNERFTLVNGRTRAIAYPGDGYNCNAEYTLAQDEKPWPANVQPPNIDVAKGQVPPAGL